MSSAKRDGWAIKGPDGRIYVETFDLEDDWLALFSLDLDEHPMTVCTGSIDDCEREAKRLGYQLVRVRLVEVDAEIVPPAQPEQQPKGASVNSFLRGLRCLIRGHTYSMDCAVHGRLWVRTCKRCGSSECFIEIESEVRDEE